MKQLLSQGKLEIQNGLFIVNTTFLTVVDKIQQMHEGDSQFDSYKMIILFFAIDMRKITQAELLALNGLLNGSISSILRLKEYIYKKCQR